MKNNNKLGREGGREDEVKEVDEDGRGAEGKKNSPGNLGM